MKVIASLPPNNEHFIYWWRLGSLTETVV